MLFWVSLMATSLPLFSKSGSKDPGETILTITTNVKFNFMFDNTIKAKFIRTVLEICL